jgi:hypothetical protein
MEKVFSKVMIIAQYALKLGHKKTASSEQNQKRR